MKTILSKKELDSKEKKIIEFVQAGEWGMLDSLIEAMPTELAEHLLDGAEFSISPEIQSTWLWKATWLRKLYMASAKSSGWSGGDNARACILALAISSRTGEKSIYRKKANRIKTLDCSGLMSSGQRHVFDRKTHAAFIIDLLNRALSVAQNLEKIEFYVCNDAPLLLDRVNFPKNLKQLQVSASGQSLDATFLQRLPDLETAHFQASRLLIDQSRSPRETKTKITVDERLLESLDPGVAELLVAESRDLNFGHLQALSVQDAGVLTLNKGALNFGSLALEDECLNKLKAHPS